MRTSCLVFVASLLVAPGAMAQTMSPAPDPIVIGTAQESLLPTLIDLARRHVEAAPTGPALAYARNGTAHQPNTRTNRPARKKGLIFGLGGVAAAATGAYLWRTDDGPNLPGITSGRKLAGQTMVVGGSAMAVLGFIELLR